MTWRVQTAEASSVCVREASPSRLTVSFALNQVMKIWKQLVMPLSDRYQTNRELCCVSLLFLPVVNCVYYLLNNIITICTTRKTFFFFFFLCVSVCVLTNTTGPESCMHSETWNLMQSRNKWWDFLFSNFVFNLSRSLKLQQNGICAQRRLR